MEDIIEEINAQILELNSDIDRGQEEIKVIHTTLTLTLGFQSIKLR